MKRRFSAGGGVPTTGGAYESVPAQYPFPSNSDGTGPSSNTTVNVNGQESDVADRANTFNTFNTSESQQMRRGGKVKAKKVRGDGIVQRGKTRGRFV